MTSRPRLTHNVVAGLAVMRASFPARILPTTNVFNPWDKAERRILRKALKYIEKLEAWSRARPKADDPQPAEPNANRIDTAPEPG